MLAARETRKNFLDTIEKVEADMIRENTERTEAEAKRLYPNEKWIDASELKSQIKGIRISDDLERIKVAHRLNISRLK